MKLLRKIIEKNKRERLIKENDKIVVGFSGGPDSVFLTEMLLKLRKEISFEITLVHINHLLRGDDSDGDEQFSIEYAKKNNLEIFSRKIDITTLGKLKNLTLEEAGREARYSFYQEVLERVGGNKIALAHNKDDQIETFMFRLSRGTSLEGLEGINSKRGIYIRPISEIYKNEILTYLEENSIPYRIDKTNFENEFTRNSIRLDLIPFIENRYNPKFKDKVYSLIEEIREVNRYINSEVESFSDKKNLNIQELKGLNKYIRGRVITSYLHNYGIDVSRKKVLGIEELIFKGGTLTLDLGNEYLLKKEYDLISIEKKQNVEIKNLDEVILKIPGEITFGEFVVTSEITKKNGNDKSSYYCKILDSNEVRIRSRKEGDKIVPIGMKSEKKVKELLINEKIPKEKRDQIPIIDFKGDILWIAGIRGSEIYRAKQDEKCIKFSIRRTK